MFTLEENFRSDEFYTFQTDFYLKGIFYFFGVIILLEILRSQISEVELLQLVPGFYFFIFFIAFLFLIIVSNFLFRFPIEIDNLKGYGTHITSKMEINIGLKFSFFLFSSVLIFVLNTVIPLSLDSFSSSGEKTLQNTWSLGEVILLESILLFFLISISQIPVLFFFTFNNRLSIELVSQFWKLLGFWMTVIAGFLTPTLDGYTQINFACATFFFYLLIVNFLQKRLFLKFNIFLPFGS